MVESRRRRREGARRGWMDSRVESRRGIWRGVGGAGPRPGLTPGEGSGLGGAYLVQVAHLFRFLFVIAVAARSVVAVAARRRPTRVVAPVRGPPPSSPDVAGASSAAARAAAMNPRADPSRAADARVVRWTRNATRTSRETRARDVRHARSPDPRRVVVASCRTRSSRGARAIARHDRGARNASRRTRANGGHQRASRRECRGRHRRRRRDSPLRARWGVVGPGR